MNRLICGYLRHSRSFYDLRYFFICAESFVRVYTVNFLILMGCFIPVCFRFFQSQLILAGV